MYKRIVSLLVCVAITTVMLTGAFAESNFTVPNNRSSDVSNYKVSNVDGVITEEGELILDSGMTVSKGNMKNLKKVNFKNIKDGDQITIILDDGTKESKLEMNKKSDVFYITENGKITEYDRRDYLVNKDNMESASLIEPSGTSNDFDPEYYNKYIYSRTVTLPNDAFMRADIYETHTIELTSNNTYFVESRTMVLIIAGLLLLTVSDVTQLLTWAGIGITGASTAAYVNDEFTVAENAYDESWRKRVTLDGDNWYQSFKKIRWAMCAVNGRNEGIKQIDGSTDYKFDDNYYLCNKASDAYWSVHMWD